MPDGFSFSGVQSALKLKDAMDDVSKRNSGIDVMSQESRILGDRAREIRHDPLANSLKLERQDFRKLGIGDLVELKQPNGELKYGLVKGKQEQENILDLTPISEAQAKTIQNNFPNTHYLVLSKYMPARENSSWFGWDFTKIETLIAAFTDYFLALMEKVVGKQLSRVELESKALALSIITLVLLSLGFWAFTIWRQF